MPYSAAEKSRSSPTTTIWAATSVDKQTSTSAQAAAVATPSGTEEPADGVTDDMCVAPIDSDVDVEEGAPIDSDVDVEEGDSGTDAESTDDSPGGNAS